MKDASRSLGDVGEGARRGRPKIFRTTAFRLSLTFLAIYAGAATLAIGYIYWNTTVLLGRQLDQTLAAEIKGLAEQYRSVGIRRLAQVIAERSRNPGANIYLVTDDAGRFIAGNVKTLSRELWDSVGRTEFVYRRPVGGRMENRLAVAQVFRLPGGYRLMVGRDIEERREFERVIRSAFLGGLALMVLGGLLAGWLVSRNILRRIDAVTDTSRAIMAGDLSERLPVSGTGDELDRLAESLNLMLERIERLMQGLKEVSDNIAHDLKTPLNRLRNRVEAALRAPGGEAACRAALEKTIEEADELIRTFNALLAIARLEAGAGPEALRPLDVGEVVREVGELYEPVAEAKGVRLEVTTEPGLIVAADRQLLGQALANLMDNALKYGLPSQEIPQTTPPQKIGSGAGDHPGSEGESPQAKGRIRLFARRRDDVEIGVADQGSGIPEADRERVIQRFVRLEESRSQPGTGLGLSLVAAVARLHGGRLTLADEAPGLRAVIHLPPNPAANLTEDRGNGEGKTFRSQ